MTDTPDPFLQLVQTMLAIYAVPFTDKHSRQVAEESWAQQFTAISDAQTRQQTTALIDQERRRWYAALSFLGDLEGLAPEVVGEQTRLRLDALTETVAQLTKDLEWSKAETYAIEEGAGEWKARALSAEGQIEALRPAVLAAVDAEEELAGPMPLDMRGRFLADPAESMRATVRATKAGIRARLESVLGNDAGRLSIQARLDALTGERAADEERLRQAGARVGIWYGCDTPDWLAEEILGLRARLDALEAEREAARAEVSKYGVAFGFESYKSPETAARTLLEHELTALRLSREFLEAENDKLRGDRFSIERLRMEDAAEHMEHMAIWANAKRQLQAQLATTEAARAALEAEHQRLKVQRVEQSWRWGRILGPKYDGASFEEVAQALAAAEAQLTLAESERDTYRAACVAMHNGYVGAGNAGMHRADLIQEGIRLFDQVEATRGIGHADDVAEILSWRTQLETLTPPSSPSPQEPT